LVSDIDNAKYSFKISSNNGESSSIFEFNEYVNHLYPKLNLQTSHEIELTSLTLDTMIEKTKLISDKYNFLVLDIQGAELLALKGADNFVTHHCEYIYTEISQKEIYVNGVLYNDLKNYLYTKNFCPISEPDKVHTNILFVKR
jgi:FkbM family methyltransferase